MTSVKYFSDSWRLLTGSKNWIRTVFLLALIEFIPIIGQIYVTGLLLEWSRTIAWGQNPQLSIKGTSVQSSFKTGFFAMLAQYIWLIIPYFIYFMIYILAFIPGFGLLVIGANKGIVAGLMITGSIVVVISTIAFIAVSIIVMFVGMRVAIYQRLGEGFNVSAVLKTLKTDVRGFWKLFGLYMAWTGILIVWSILGSFPSNFLNGPIDFIYYIFFIYMTMVFAIPMVVCVMASIGLFYRQQFGKTWGITQEFMEKNTQTENEM